ncbi:hypothetical protein ACIPSA_03920 [Streptomyces sp. NPDC086549]
MDRQVLEGHGPQMAHMQLAQHLDGGRCRALGTQAAKIRVDLC